MYVSDGNSYVVMDHHANSHLIYIIPEVRNPSTFPQPYLWQKALCEELLGPAAELDVEQGVVRLLDLRVPEPAQTELHHSPGKRGWINIMIRDSQLRLTGTTGVKCTVFHLILDWVDLP